MIGDRVHSVGSAAEAIGAYLQNGGLVMPPLVLCVVVLWFAIGWRWVTLNRGGAKSVRVLINNRLRDKPRVLKGIVDTAVNQGVALWAEHKPYLRERLDEAFGHYQSEIKRYSLVVSTIVAIAPLLGLLGTVIGMIETFNSLGDMTLFSQTGGIAGGIATALFTTQMGLVVAVPGYIVKSVLDRRQRQIEHDLAQIKDILCSLSPARPEIHP
ncbi:MAG: MotA/TolQ/ExbB proton channel family protein [Lysobacterales bacterium]|nr:MotA/TolQ/ExbB proton channel family protein [Xanthomonadales bacterium]MCP5476852.1 MotA/TolQ/ExbB proton channel family protein [Rhodanobacteraceae bacterium]